MDKLESKVEVEETSGSDLSGIRDTGPHDEAGDGIDRVRELLFGSKLRETEGRVRGFEEKIRAELSSLDTELRTRISALENYIKSELGALTDLLRSESDERRNAVRAIQAQAQAERDLSSKATQELGESMQRTFRETREFVSNESRMLSDRLGQASRDLFEELGRIDATLTSSKVDRHTLAEFFGELAHQIDDSPVSRGSEGSHDRPRRN